MNNHQQGKSPFRTKKLRDLDEKETELITCIEEILSGSNEQDILETLPEFVSHDSKKRPLVISLKILQKIFKDHGLFDMHNFIINMTSWEYVLKCVDGDSDRINLIKLIPKSNNFFLIGARRINGYFILTHFEVIAKNGNELKNLLRRGDVLDRSGRTPSLIETGLPSY